LTDPSNSQYDYYLAGRLHRTNLRDRIAIITTLNLDLEKKAQDIVRSRVARVGYLNVTDGALVSIDVRKSCYGCIMAIVGTANVDRRSHDINMANSPIEPGSLFMPFNYVSAFEKGLAPGTVVCDGTLKIPLGTLPRTYYSPSNYDGSFEHGCLPLRDALAESLNVPAVKTEIFNGINRVANTAIKFGISDLRRDNPGCCRGIWATTLGELARGVKLIQETADYGVFATNGIKVPPISFTKIVDRTTGKVLWRYSQDPVLRQRRHRVAPGPDAYLITSILSDNNARASEFGLHSSLRLTHASAAKTGTTNSFTDNWTEGYTPQIVTGVWVGNADYAPMIGSTGVTGAAPIWHSFMERAFRILQLPDKPFTQPPGVVEASMCREANSPSPRYGIISDLTVNGMTPYCSRAGGCPI
jgi:membrane peptidoglycan carboxypeptidase